MVLSDEARFINRLRRTTISIERGIVRIWESDEILGRFCPPPLPTCQQTQPQSESHATTKKEVRNLI